MYCYFYTILHWTEIFRVVERDSHLYSASVKVVFFTKSTTKTRSNNYAIDILTLCPKNGYLIVLSDSNFSYFFFLHSHGSIITDLNRYISTASVRPPKVKIISKNVILMTSSSKNPRTICSSLGTKWKIRFKIIKIPSLFLLHGKFI